MKIKIAKAGEPDKKGYIYSIASLRNMGKHTATYWDEEEQTLYYIPIKDRIKKEKP
jgi:hypothetical protein